MWSNFHTHSNYCDGKGTLASYVTAAAEKKVAILGFSSHAPVPFPCNWCMKAESLQSYLDEIEQLRGNSENIEIYKSLEIDFIPGKISPADFENKLDYTVGSIHFTDEFPDGRPWEIDGPHIPFLEGLKIIFKDDMRAAVTRYFELTREMIDVSSPDIVGHLDKIKIQNPGNKFFLESDSWYVDEIKKTLKAIKSAGSIVEVNTRGIYQKKSDTTYPSPWVLSLLNQENIPVTISSDAHHPDDLINQFADTALLLQKTEFKKLSAFHEGVWKAFSFDENGLLFVS